jgi:hypothetical protein
MQDFRRCHHQDPIKALTLKFWAGRTHGTICGFVDVSCWGNNLKAGQVVAIPTDASSISLYKWVYQ